MQRSPGEPDRPCLWMSAGLISYKLCDRDFDCESCPLDAALRGEPDRAPGPSPLPLPGAPIVFPADRWYAAGHLWVSAEDADGQVRCGLDALAAALVGPPTRARVASEGAVAAGEPVCELDVAGGALVLSAPLACRAVAINPRLLEDPGLAARDPYEHGWIAALAPAKAAGPVLLDATAVSQRSALDLRHLRRRIALDLLSAPDLGPTLADGGAPLTDVRGMVGARRFLALVRELVH